MAAKEPLVLLPGILSDAAFWHHQVIALADICDPVVIDVSRSATTPGLAADVLAEAPPVFALAGLSLGGYVALEIMRQAPQRVTRLALLDTHARLDPPESTPRRQAMIDKAQAGGYREIMPQMFAGLVHPDSVNTPMKDEMIAQAERLGAEAFVRQMLAMRERIDSRATLKDIRVPTVVLCGEADRITPPDLSEEIAQGIPGARLHIIKGAGHLSPLERPEAVNPILREWLLA